MQTTFHQTGECVWHHRYPIFLNIIGSLETQTKKDDTRPFPRSFLFHPTQITQKTSQSAKQGLYRDSSTVENAQKRPSNPWKFLTMFKESTKYGCIALATSSLVSIRLEPKGAQKFQKGSPSISVCRYSANTSNGQKMHGNTHFSSSILYSSKS